MRPLTKIKEIVIEIPLPACQYALIGPGLHGGFSGLDRKQNPRRPIPPRQVSLVASCFLKHWVNRYSNKDLAKCVKTKHQIVVIDWQNGPDASVIKTHDSSVLVVGLGGVV